MKTILKSITLEFFKGVQNKTYNFSNPITRILGMNRLGKTTLADAYMWVFFDKNYALVSNPQIRPTDIEECVPKVTIVLDVDGKEITISKAQKRKVSKPDANGISKVSLTNTYEVNSVPKAERDFKSYLEDMGFDLDNMLACTHPSVFTSQKAADMRKVLFKMASEKSDFDIASMSSETADVAKLLSDYSMEEISAMNKASKKKADEQCKSIPDQIVGLEKAKVDVDVAELELAKNGLTEEIMRINDQISNSNSVIDDLKQEKLNLGFEISDLKRTANEKLIKERRAIEDQQYEASKKFEDLHRKISSYEKEIADKKTKIAVLESEKKKLGEQYYAKKEETFDESSYVFDESKWIFDESSTVCSLCGQTLPSDKIEFLKAEFETKKAKAKADVEDKLKNDKFHFENAKKIEINRIITIGNEKKEQITSLKNEVEEFEKILPDLRQQEIEQNRIKNDFETKLAEMPTDADLTQNEEYKAFMDKDAKLDEQIKTAIENSVDTTGLEAEKSAKLKELDAVKTTIAQSANNIRIDEKIEELQNQQRDYEQTKADAEKILYQLDLVSKKKNELLVDDINSHFKMVKWQLFDFQKNGEYKEVCIPTIGGYRFGESTNTGRDIEARLDICNSLQNFFGTAYPIWLDNAESLNDCYLPQLDTQMVVLKVSDDTEIRVE